MIKTTDRMCCFALENGIKWCGYILTGLSSLGVIICIALVMNYEEVIVVTSANSTDVVVHRALLGEQASYLVMLVYCALGVAFSYLLVLAVTRRNRNFLLPWLISNAISTLFMVIALSPILLPLTIVFAPFLLGYYFYYCVYSYYVLLRDEHVNQMNSTGPAEALSPQYAN